MCARVPPSTVPTPASPPASPQREQLSVAVRRTPDGAVALQGVSGVANVVAGDMLVCGPDAVVHALDTVLMPVPRSQPAAGR